MSADEAATIFIVDDDAAIRDSLQLLLKSAGLNVVCYESAELFLEAYDTELRGCLVLDVRMPGMSGLELQRALNERNSQLPVIIMTGHGDVPMAVDAMKAGATDFIEKPFSDEDLLTRLQSSIERQQRQLAEHANDIELLQRLSLLTPREREVMDLLAEGKLNKVVAAELDISPRTVEVHRARIMEKLRVKSLADIVRVSLMIS
ncbi:MAG: hypothetical protein AMJ69_06970 [Gammaproteobacteria bacterium SG8_47]|nr:MAG: hypothetical protein AMJ69_06970 [Gammaproteobacteria bacterium SG8_47]